MKNLLINSAKIAQNSITAHTRNAIILSNELGIEMVSTAEEIKQLDRSAFNNFIIVGAAFYPKTAEIEAWIRSGDIKRIVWINNEYQVSPNSEYARLIKDHPSLLISNVVKSANKGNSFDEFKHINLNALLFDSRVRELDKKYSLIYYGTYRPGRRLYLQKYFHDSDFYISSSSKNIRKFHQLCGINANFCDKLNWERDKETLNLFKYSLYAEDEYTHTHFNFLANRFYECLTCNVVQFFDASCLKSIELAGYRVIDRYIVHSKEELENKVNSLDFNECLNEQRQAWHSTAKRERQEVIECLSQHLTRN